LARLTSAPWIKAKPASPFQWRWSTRIGGPYGEQIVKILESIDVLDLTNLSTPEEAEQQVLDSQVVAAVADTGWLHE